MCVAVRMCLCVCALLHTCVRKRTDHFFLVHLNANHEPCFALDILCPHVRRVSIDQAGPEKLEESFSVCFSLSFQSRERDLFCWSFCPASASVRGGGLSRERKRKLLGGSKRRTNLLPEPQNDSSNETILLFSFSNVSRSTMPPSSGPPPPVPIYNPFYS